MGSTTQENRMTNILLITADDMDSNTPGSFGGPDEATPNRVGILGNAAGR